MSRTDRDQTRAGIELSKAQNNTDIEQPRPPSSTPNTNNGAANGITTQTSTVSNPPTFWEHRAILDHIEDSDLPDSVRDFVNSNDFPRNEAGFEALVLKAARVIKNENSGLDREGLKEKIDGLTDSDLDLLEAEGKWRSQPLYLWFTIVVNSIAAVIQGWDQTGTNGANLLWPASLHRSTIGCHVKHVSLHASTSCPLGPISPPCMLTETTPTHGTCYENTLLEGLVNAAPYIMICLCACWLSDPCNFFTGRRKTIFIGALCSLAAPLGSAFTHSWQQLFGCRLVLGFGMGLKEVTVPILSAEIAPRQIRGALIMSWQIFTALGIVLGSAANLIALDRWGQQPNVVWRYQLGSAVIPAGLLVSLVLGGPESPRWLIRKRRYRDAYSSLLGLRGRGNELLAARDLFSLHYGIKRADEAFTGRQGLRRFPQLFTDPRVRRATLAASILMISQQLCGINILAFYSSTIFSTTWSGSHISAPNSTRIALLFTLGFGVLNFLFAWPAFFTVDKVGRRPLLISTIPLMCLFMLLSGLLYLIPGKATRLDVVPVFIYLFVVAYSPGVGPMAFTYSAEVFPITHREIGMSWAVAMNNLFAAALALGFPSIWDTFRPRGTGSFLFFAGLNAISFILVFLLVPETHLRTLEDLDSIFDRSTVSHITHEAFDVVDWAWERVRQKTKKSCPRFADS